MLSVSKISDDLKSHLKSWAKDLLVNFRWIPEAYQDRC